MKLTDGNNTIWAWAHIAPRSGSEVVDDIIEQGDAFTFIIHRTDRNKRFLATLTNLTAIATRSMPERILSIVSSRPTDDRMFLNIECRG